MQRGTSGGGLSRYRSAPATWLEALLESDTETEQLPISHTTTTTTTTTTTPPTKPPPHPTSTHHHLPDLKPAIGSGGGGGATRFAADLGLFESGVNSNFVRQNSSPADFLSQISTDSYFSSYGLDYLSSQPNNKRPRDDDSETNLSKGEPSGQLRGSGGSMDAEMEKLMEDLVPCKVRAKRGCATHPRSIAERVRRTRISDRIRKLQELVPNMDKQTNTADMLDEAVEYVKFLQKQIQELTEHQKKCTCSMKDQ